MTQLSLSRRDLTQLRPIALLSKPGVGIARGVQTPIRCILFHYPQLLQLKTSCTAFGVFVQILLYFHPLNKKPRLLTAAY